MRPLRLLVTILAMLAPLGLVAAAPSDSTPDRGPSTQDPSRPQAIAVDQWLQLLPAPVAAVPPANHHVAWPLRGTLTQPFGCTGFDRERPAQECPSGFHTGIDLAQPQGTPIHAAGPGTAYPLADTDRYGNFVVIQHQGGYATVYGHMVRSSVSWGQSVQAGDLIGWVGSTGNSTGPHLHFEVRFAGAPQDPVPYLDGSPPDPFTLPAGWPGAPPDDWRGVR